MKAYTYKMGYPVQYNTLVYGVEESDEKTKASILLQIKQYSVTDVI